MKLPQVIVYGERLGGGATNTLPEGWVIPSLADILPYAPKLDRSELASDNPFILSCAPATRTGYPESSD